MWFGKAVEDFNTGIAEAGSGGPQLIASTTNGFVSEWIPLQMYHNRHDDLQCHSVVWVGFAFYAVPVVCSLAKLHVAAGKA